MNTLKEFLDESWHRLAGVAYRPKKALHIASLRKSEWSVEFETYMRNRMVMGAFRYGPIADQDFGMYDLPAEIHKRVCRYERTRNLECLVDAANLCLIAFLHGQRIGETMQSEDDGEHAEVLGI